MTNDVLKLRANKRVLEQACASCGRAFQLAEEVYQCKTCNGFHHVSCFDAAGYCNAAGAPPVAATSPMPPYADIPGAGAATKPMEPPPGTYGAAAAPTGGALLGPDEMRCPGCAGVVKRDALKCWHCGRQLGGAGGLSFGGYVPGALGMGETDPEIERKAGEALKGALVGIICFGFILGPYAIIRGSQTLSGLSARPDYPASSSARTKAIVGIVVGSLDVLLNILGFIGRAMG